MSSTFSFGASFTPLVSSVKSFTEIVLTAMVGVAGASIGWAAKATRHIPSTARCTIADMVRLPLMA